ncbi:NYN domain-containing protein [Campylobacter sp. 19-13652]|uniref:NYN domain-containing protein n=1 Tax=Campylobacter sp. 19-13652 TaxID=2840180 RepID=UPI001C75C7F3|nr:NYN domain-containing protein [Campylobacter sp. 19-13652]BCX79243.1 hypothetical protein LBC_07050 [Campylobacter sp. 19-13652]
MRVIAYIDGYNLYHSIDDLKDDSLKWLDLRKLCERFLKDGDELVQVFYFTASPTHIQEKLSRHQAYTKALQKAGVTPIFGKFKKKIAKCKICKQSYQTHEEKQSDINIAINLIKHALTDRFDKAFLITADTDLVSTIKMLKRLAPQKPLILLTPPNRHKYATELIQNATSHREIKKSHLKQALLDECGRPEKYNPKKG